MQTKTVTNHENVMREVSKFLSDLCFEGKFRNHPDYLTEIFDYILETEIGNDFELRIKMLSCIRTSKMLVKTLEPFSDEEIEKVCVEMMKKR